MDNISEMIQEVKDRNAKRVLLQLPEGLKTKSTEILSRLDEAGITAYVHNRPAYGACDLADRDAARLGCDLLVHVGHSKFYRDFDVAVPVLYYPWKIDIVLDDIDFSVISEKRIGLVSSVQHLHMLEQVAEKLQALAKKALIGGQILGCWSANATKIENDVDVFLVVGSGYFHPLGVKSDKKIYVLDAEKNEISLSDSSMMEKRRWAGIYNARNAKSFGILVSTKPGQFNLLDNAQNLKKKIESHQKKAYVMVMDNVRDDELMGMHVDAFVNTACPRLLDNSWSKPVINAYDIDSIFEEGE